MKQLIKIKLFCLLTSFIIILFIMFSSCDKNNDDNSNNNITTDTLTFTSLTAEKDTVIVGTTTPNKITAIATGDNITYSWSKTLTGSILLGSGNKVDYIAPPCTVGNDEITCKVTDAADNSESKTIIITIILQ